MPGKSGLQLVDELSRTVVPYEVIFTTAYNEYALKAFRLSAIDYLLKPIDENQLAEAVAKIRLVKSAQQSEIRLQHFLKNMKKEQILITFFFLLSANHRYLHLLFLLKSIVFMFL